MTRSEFRTLIAPYLVHFAMWARGAFFLILFLLVSSCEEKDNIPSGNDIDALEEFSGGATTIFNSTMNAFSQGAPSLSPEGVIRHLSGEVQFEIIYPGFPNSPHKGLGPLFNNNSCGSCHFRDGRGRPPTPGEDAESLLLRMSRNGSDEHGGPLPVPGFGTQLQPKAISGWTSEGTLNITWAEIPGSFADGTPYQLRMPSYSVAGPASPELVSPRMAPPVFGLGLLEAIPEAVMQEGADENDVDGNGISGRLNYVWNEASGRLEAGRFGWKANQPTLLQQTAAAFHEDMGVTSPYYAYEACGCDSTEDEPEIPQEILDNVSFYVQTLAVPGKRNAGGVSVVQGRQLFDLIGCSSCHHIETRTGTFPGLPEVSDQTIHAYTDLLLHDMGPGLADGRPDFLATGSEWRTPPLWGIGLTAIVNGNTFYLHDGRARSLDEAILWHSGEAEQSKERFRTMSSTERENLIAFLNSL